jgi:hypothetical protein
MTLVTSFFCFRRINHWLKSMVSLHALFLFCIPVLLLCVLRKRKTKVMSARLDIIMSNLLSQYSIRMCTFRPAGVVDRTKKVITATPDDFYSYVLLHYWSIYVFLMGVILLLKSTSERQRSEICNAQGYHQAGCVSGVTVIWIWDTGAVLLHYLHIWF